MDKYQKIQLDRVKSSSFNNMNGPNIAKSLKKNAHLWIAFLFGYFGIFKFIDLRNASISANYDGIRNRLGFQGDTLILLCHKKDLDAMKEIMADWEYNEFGYNTYDRKNNVFVAVDQAPCRTEKDLFMDFGSFDERDCLIRVWWD